MREVQNGLRGCGRELEKIMAEKKNGSILLVNLTVAFEEEER